MRESLFRGKRLDNGEWVSSGNLITFNDEGEGKQFFIPQMNAKCTCTHDEQDNIISFDSGMFYKVDPETVGQFTGLTDKNGKRIFEGDIVKDDSGVVYPVVFSLTGFCLKYAPPYSCGFHYDMLPLSNYWHAHGAIIEVIGNIHDNPELLEGEEDED